MNNSIQVGDFYEDCAYHPCLCTSSDGDDLAGASMFDGSGPRGCSVMHCAPRKLTLEQVLFKVARKDEWLAAGALWRAGNLNDEAQVEFLFGKLWHEETERFGS